MSITFKEILNQLDENTLSELSPLLSDKIVSAYTKKQLAIAENNYRTGYKSTMEIIDKVNNARKYFDLDFLNIPILSPERLFSSITTRGPDIELVPELETDPNSVTPYTSVLSEKEKMQILNCSKSKKVQGYDRFPEIPDASQASPDLNPKIKNAYNPTVINDTLKKLEDKKLKKEFISGDDVVQFVDLYEVASRVLANQTIEDISKPRERGGAGLGDVTGLKLFFELFPTLLGNDYKLLGNQTPTLELQALPLVEYNTIDIPEVDDNTSDRIGKYYLRDRLEFDVTHNTFPCPTFSVEFIVGVVKLILTGKYGQNEIAAELGVTRDTVRKVQNRYFDFPKFFRIDSSKEQKKSSKKPYEKMELIDVHISLEQLDYLSENPRVTTHAMYDLRKRYHDLSNTEYVGAAYINMNNSFVKRYFVTAFICDGDTPQQIANVTGYGLKFIENVVREYRLRVNES